MKISSVQHQHQHQAMATHLDEFLGCPKPHHQPNQQQDQKKPRPRPRPQPEQAPSCPRCDSSNTKFCYYNNYSLSQPRYFCKGCRRYWTKGGSLRNVPVGGGCRKNHKRSSNSSSSNSNSSTNSSSSSSKKSNDAVHDHLTVVPNPDPLLPALPLPPLSFDPADLTLAFASDSFMLSCPNPSTGTSTTASTSAAGFLDILRGGDNLSYYGFGGIGSNMDQTEGAGASVSTGDAATAGAGLMMFPNFDGGLLNSTASASSVCTESVTATTEMDHHSVNVYIEGENSNSNPNKVAMGMGMGLHHHHHHHQWPVVDHGHAAAANLSLDPARDYYWNGVGAAAAPWHGLINSSLM